MNVKFEGELTPASDRIEDVLNTIFECFQRVTSLDHERLLELHYELPSLSAGDRIEIDGEAWRVDAVGFSRDERDPNEPLNPWPLGD